MLVKQGDELYISEVTEENESVIREYYDFKTIEYLGIQKILKKVQQIAR